MNEIVINERIGVNATESMCIKHGWCFREQPVMDYGVDAIIELIDDKRNSVNLVALQIKSGKTYFNEKSGKYYVFRFEEKHKRYWETYQIPVVIVLYDFETKLLICQVFQERSVEKCQNGYKLLVNENSSFERFLDDEAKNIRKLPDYIYNYNYMLTQLPFIQRIKEGYNVILHSEEWINKSSGRGHIYLEISKKDEIEEYHWNYWFPFQPYQDVFKRLFPWANFTVDEDFVHDFEKDDFMETNFYRIIMGKTPYSFDEYKRQLPMIRGVIKGGELATYKIHLSVNEFGEAFYLTHKELMDINVYTGLKISKVK